jgi:MFS family permease
MRLMWYNQGQTRTGGERMSRAARTQTRAERIVTPPAGPLARITGLRTFRSLENPVYRSLWLGLLTVYLAMQVSMIARGYLAFQLSGSAASLGLVMLARGVPQFILSPVGGVVADRIEKRQLLVVTQAAMVVLSSVTAVLVLTDVIAIWHLVVLGALEGAVWVFNMPARQALVPELVGDEDLMGAIALNSAGFNATRIVGPAAAGVLISTSWCGIGGVFLVVVVCHAVFILSLARLPEGRRREARHASGSMFGQVGSGFRYIGRSSALVVLLLMGAVPIILGMAYQTLLPVFQERVLDVGPRELGLLYAGAGVGALSGALTLASLSGVRRKDVLQIGFGVAFGAALVLFAQMPVFWGALVAVVLVGFFGNTFTALNNSMLMMTADRAYHGRVISIYEMLWSCMMFASWPIGILVDAAGAPWTVTVFGVLVAAVILALAPARLKRAPSSEAA